MRKYSSAEQAEMAGNAMARDLIDKLIVLRDQNQAASLRALIASLEALAEVEGNQKDVIAGWAVMMVNVLEVGIVNLPRGPNPAEG